MTDDTTPKPIHAVLAQVAFDLGPIAKSDMNTQQGFAYRGIETILAKAGPLMSAHGIVWLPRVVDKTVETILVGKYEKPWRLVSLTVEYEIVGPAGDSLRVVTIGEGFDPGDKAGNKAMTGAYKYALLQVLGIADGHDEADADAAADPAPRRTEKKSTGKADPPPDYENAPVRSSKPVGKSEAPPKIDMQTGEVKQKQNGVTAKGNADRDSIVELMNSIADEGQRRSVKNLFMTKFGEAPSKLSDTMASEARAWVQQQIDEPSF